MKLQKEAGALVTYVAMPGHILYLQFLLFSWFHRDLRYLFLVLVLIHQFYFSFSITVVTLIENTSNKA